MLSRICCLASLLILCSGAPAAGQESAEAATTPPVEPVAPEEASVEETLCPSEAVTAQTVAVEEAAQEAQAMEAALAEIMALVEAREASARN